MKWKAEWWGVIIEAETDEDEKLLRALVDVTPERAYEYYDDGDLEVDEGSQRISLLFNR